MLHAFSGAIEINTLAVMGHGSKDHRSMPKQITNEM